MADDGPRPIDSLPGILKLRTIAWARQHGVYQLFTACEIENTPMIAINKRLGYQSGVRRLAVAHDLSSTAVPTT
jgi:hypothetical protein